MIDLVCRVSPYIVHAFITKLILNDTVICRLGTGYSVREGFA
jgi:hypothetical protein